MRQVTSASLWALGLLGSAIVARFGLAGDAMALFLVLLMGAGASLAQSSRCGSC